MCVVRCAFAGLDWSSVHAFHLGRSTNHFRNSSPCTPTWIRGFRVRYCLPCRVGIRDARTRTQVGAASKLFASRHSGMSMHTLDHRPLPNIHPKSAQSPTWSYRRLDDPLFRFKPSCRFLRMCLRQFAELREPQDILGPPSLTPRRLSYELDARGSGFWRRRRNYRRSSFSFILSALRRSTSHPRISKISKIRKSVYQIHRYMHTVCIRNYRYVLCSPDHATPIVTAGILISRIGTR